uniref:Uncharacterized protein n=1 Tax=Trichogramma kaykai TaxID=54128 RepID=A0ABD2VUG8_9HYME
MIRRVDYEDGPIAEDDRALPPLEKLKRLEELQRRRDMTEKFYSSEIRRLIGTRSATNEFGSGRTPPSSPPISQRYSAADVATNRSDKCYAPSCDGGGNRAQAKLYDVSHREIALLSK